MFCWTIWCKLKRDAVSIYIVSLLVSLSYISDHYVKGFTVYTPCIYIFGNIVQNYECLFSFNCFLLFSFLQIKTTDVSVAADKTTFTIQWITNIIKSEMLNLFGIRLECINFQILVYDVQKKTQKNESIFLE